MRGKLMAAGSAVICAALWSAVPASASTTWRVQAVPAPANSYAELLGVSCPATGTCTAVGFSSIIGSATQSTLAERWAGGHWAIQPTPSPGTGAVGQLTGVSCLSATDCTAVGIDSTPTAANSTLVEHWDGSTWTVVPSPDPAGTAVTDFTGVSCASPTSCTAVGLYDTSGNRPHELPFAEHWDGTSWTVQRVPLPSGATGGGLDGGVSCPSATRCIAVGSVAISGLASNTEPLAERWNGTRWTVQTTVNPAGSYNPYLSGVSCSAPGHCTAVGGYLANGSTPTALIERWDGTAWTAQAGAGPANTELAGVSCTSGTSCTAVGSGVAEHWNGTAWALQTLPARGMNVLAVSCRSATTCTAVGWNGRHPHPLADHE